MSEDAKCRVVLRNERDADGSSCRLEAYVDGAGSLVLEGQDIGAAVEASWGDSDYEYWRVVRAEHVPKVLLELIKDRFRDDVEFAKWLREKEIQCEFDSWV